MANRSTFNRDLPRNMTKLAALSQTPDGYTKRQMVVQYDRVTDAVRLDSEGKPKMAFQVLPDYDRMIRLLLKEAHAVGKAFKLKRLAKDVVADLNKTETAETKVAEAA